MSLILYTNPMSRGRIARWALEETGTPYEARILQYGAEMKAPEFCALNPMGKIPVLCHDGVTVTETAAILAYLADAFPEAKLAPPPASPAARPLLPLAVLRRRPAGGRHHRQIPQRRSAAGKSRLRRLRHAWH